ncbi:hypothetical protein JCM19300_3255 [Algibacter lectus]|nr:hypothetical protein JCM19300_3255 [Algibacter lectus]
MIVIFKKVQIYGSKFVDKKLVVYFFAFAEREHRQHFISLKLCSFL